MVDIFVGSASVFILLGRTSEINSPIILDAWGGGSRSAGGGESRVVLGGGSRGVGWDPPV